MFSLVSVIVLFLVITRDHEGFEVFPISRFGVFPKSRFGVFPKSRFGVFPKSRFELL